MKLKMSFSWFIHARPQENVGLSSNICELYCRLGNHICMLVLDVIDSQNSMSYIGKEVSI
jgi:hypothetical protein